MDDVNPVMPDGKTKDGLPKEVERFHMKGHKDTVTSLDFHPIQDLLASSSEDASIKLWDSESGE